MFKEVFVNPIDQVPETSNEVPVLVTYTWTLLSPLPESIEFEIYTLAFPFIIILPVPVTEVACVPSGAVTTAVIVLASFAYIVCLNTSCLVDAEAVGTCISIVL